MSSDPEVPEEIKIVRRGQFRAPPRPKAISGGCVLTLEEYLALGRAQQANEKKGSE